MWVGIWKVGKEKGYMMFDNITLVSYQRYLPTYISKLSPSISLFNFLNICLKVQIYVILFIFTVFSTSFNLNNDKTSTCSHYTYKSYLVFLNIDFDCFCFDPYLYAVETSAVFSGHFVD